jgi:hypothetical protein
VKHTPIKPRPWDKWHPDERWQIISDYQQGTSIRRLAIRYRRNPYRISAYLKHLGIMRTGPQERPKVRIIERPSTPSMRKLAWSVLMGEQLLNRCLRADEIGRIMEEIRYQNGGRVHVGTETALLEKGGAPCQTT